MNDKSQLSEQAKIWNGPAGQAWVDMQSLLDRLLKPAADALMQALSASRCERVLDVGCGTGGTTLAIARADSARRCTGIDISSQMMEAARSQAAREDLPVSFVCADAQTYAFAPDSFDTVVSRFGVMFFPEPIEAFRNIRRATREGGRLHFIAWRCAAENPFMTTAERIAAPLLPNMPARSLDGPGQFAFADPLRVEEVLSQSGWTEIEIRSADMVCSMPESQLDLYLDRLGPVGAALREVDEPTRKRVVEAVRAGFESYVHDDEVRFTAACWVVSARAGAVRT
ncbi:class I SAM-dependent methyltransferase [Trinickia sp. NRRL B-1857]|uniref:class I SAM-dependent methyltransferase n=1 Tax=Trinickia sp. NRRL B-1857 TaxID=3162879 RepID=UPI003D265076